MCSTLSYSLHDSVGCRQAVYCIMSMTKLCARSGSFESQAHYLAAVTISLYTSIAQSLLNIYAKIVSLKEPFHGDSRMALAKQCGSIRCA